jgi:hypothetical protein
LFVIVGGALLAAAAVSGAVVAAGISVAIGAVFAGLAWAVRRGPRPSADRRRRAATFGRRAVLVTRRRAALH